MRGLVVYRGPSRLDGAPIAVVVTLESGNVKTGPMAQAWVIRADIDPQRAIATGQDASICGSCVHRSGGPVGRSCYVVTWFGPLNVWRSFAAGQYPDVAPPDAALALAGLQLRVTAYGDPAAAPFEIWRPLLRGASTWTGYTHQWRTCDQRFRDVLMASVESSGEVAIAQALGWRTFRTRLEDEPVRPDEIICPASDEAGHRTTCDHCGLCVGRRRQDARSVVIIAHGQRVRWFADHKELVNA